MKVILFGATGMVGQGVLRECLLDPSVESVLYVGRTPSNQKHPKFEEILLKDLTNYDSISDKLKNLDAGFFCLGTTSAGKSEEEYTKVTYDITLAAAKKLSSLNPQMTFVYVSGQGADSSEKGPVMWARVRGKTENDLLKLPFKAAYVFRPGVIQPLHGIQSQTKLYRVLYNVLDPVMPALRKMFPNTITTTELIGKAMLQLVKTKSDKKILNNPDISKMALTTKS